jgi:dihydroneopterin aldolase
LHSFGTLVVSLHGIRLHALIGMYAEEKILGNEFEVDVDVTLPVPAGSSLPFADYTRIHALVHEEFGRRAALLEEVIPSLHAALGEAFSETTSIRIAIRKLHPPMPGEVAFAQVIFDAKP